MSTTQFKTAAAYFNAQLEKVKDALMVLKQCILTVNPNAKESLNYNIPAYALVAGGKRDQQVMIAGYKNHVGFYPHPTTIEKFDSALSEFKTGKGSVQFALDKPIPVELIEDMVSYRMHLLKQ